LGVTRSRRGPCGQYGSEQRRSHSRTGGRHGRRSHRRVLTAVGAGDLRQARARQVGDGAWTPEILLIGTDITDADPARLQQLLTSLPRVSIAAVRET
jgi:hypothetical protein